MTAAVKDDPGWRAPGELPMSANSFRQFAEFITREVGIQVNESKTAMLQSRLMRRVHSLQLGSLDEYLDYLFHSPGGEEERTHFIDAITTNKTDFFREPVHFDYLTDIVARTATVSSAPFDVWCAGCSSGEEPYTIAMVLEECRTKFPALSYSILATDISTRMLRHAHTAIYSADRVDPVPETVRQKYILRSKDPRRSDVRVCPAIRSRVTFRQLNFMDASYGVSRMFQVVFFRNVMIYFDKATQRAVVSKLCRNLVPGGTLFVGHSESLAGLDVPLRQIAPAVFTRL